MQDPSKELLTVAEVAALTRLSRSAVYRAVEEGELEAYKIRGRLRITRADYERWLDACRIKRERRDPSFEGSLRARPPVGTFARKLAERRGR